MGQSIQALGKRSLIGQIGCKCVSTNRNRGAAACPSICASGLAIAEPMNQTLAAKPVPGKPPVTHTLGPIDARAQYNRSIGRARGIQFDMAAESKSRSTEVLARLEHDMANLKDALGTLGLRPCSLCGKFYPISNPGNLFTIRDAICYACLSGWWPDHRRSLDQADRQLSESKLSDWLTRYHNAQVFREFRICRPRNFRISTCRRVP